MFETFFSRFRFTLALFSVLFMCLAPLGQPGAVAHARQTFRTTRLASMNYASVNNSWNVVPSPDVAVGPDQLDGVAVISASDIWEVGFSSGGGYYHALTENWNGMQWNAVSSPNPGDVGASLLGVTALSASDVWAVGDYIDQEQLYTLIEHWDGTQWSVIPGPTIRGSELNAVSAVSANDIWAVGYYYNSSFVRQTLIEHWNGTQWSVVSSPNVGSNNNILSAVTAVSANNVWAVGYSTNDSNIDQTLIEDWNGAQWSVASSPNVNGNGQLNGVMAVSANDIWAVGYYSNSGQFYQTLVEQWNGTNWSIVQSPNVGSNNTVLSAVTASSANSVWAVGYYETSNYVEQTLIEYWNGANWQVVSSPNGGSQNNVLSGVAVVSARNIWAVGYYLSFNQDSQSLALHWNGSHWSFAQNPNAGVSPNYLSGIAAVSASDVWAVGDYFNSITFASQALALHWNGTRWSIVPSPNFASTSQTFENDLYGVAAVSSNNVWAVGYYTNTSDQTLTEHWNGSHWSVVPSPNPSGTYDHYLYGVAAASADNIWAVGNSDSSQTLIEQWNGSQWNIASSPSPGTTSNELQGVTALSSKDAWAVGYYEDVNSSVSQTLIEHWDGSSWQVVPSPNPSGSLYNDLYGVAAVSANNIWAVGTYEDSGYTDQTLIEHWDGSSWQVVPSPDPSSQYNDLYGVAAISANNIWAVGYMAANRTTLIEHWNGTQWNVVPSANPGTNSNQLNGVVAVSSNNIWAVGYYANGSGNPDVSQTLTEFYS